MRLILNRYPEWATMDKLGLNTWIKVLADTFEKKIGKLQYSFVDNDEIININQQYLNHDYPTDVITFEYNEGELIAGEVFIGVETVKENARSLLLANSNELDRVIAHGFLHLIGFRDKTEEEKTAMRTAEDKCLLLRPKNLTNK